MGVSPLRTQVVLDRDPVPDLRNLGDFPVLAFEHGLHQYLKTSHGALLSKLDNEKAMDKDAEAELTEAITSFKKSFA